MNQAQFKKLASTKNAKIGEKKFDFTELKDEDLKDFWQKQGGHF